MTHFLVLRYLVGFAYGSLRTPTTLGSGGGRNGYGVGAPGGAALHLVVHDTLRVDGVITVSGGDSVSPGGYQSGGGAGGSIWIESQVFVGSGL